MVQSTNEGLGFLVHLSLAIVTDKKAMCVVEEMNKEKLFNREGAIDACIHSLAIIYYLLPARF